jgi:hypothetical protein
VFVTEEEKKIELQVTPPPKPKKKEAPKEVNRT